MGSVAMKSKFLGNSPIDGYPDVETTVYIYCDKCGSFDIDGYIEPTTWKKIGVGLIVGTLGCVVAIKIMTIRSLDSGLTSLLSCPFLLFTGFVVFNIFGFFSVKLVIGAENVEIQKLLNMVMCSTTHYTMIVF